ncbi:hypothetical protein ACN47E_001131 [Coniothyrium glycines]
MSSPKHTPKKSNGGRVNVTPTSRFQSNNTFAALSASAGAGIDDDNDSRASSDGPPSLVMTPAAGQTNRNELLQSQASPSEHRPHVVARAGSDGNSSSFTSPTHRRLTQLGRGQIFPRQPFASSPRAMPLSNLPIDAQRPSTLTGIPEILAVQELGFRRGQQDFSATSDDIPASPFAREFDFAWADSYRAGRSVGGTPAGRRDLQAPHNYTWSVLINPYTQNIEHPGGTFDPAWSRWICEKSLDCMQARIQVVCRREKEWDKIVCEIPVAAHGALQIFPDLRARYGKLRADAKEASEGACPPGYSR